MKLIFCNFWLFAPLFKVLLPMINSSGEALLQVNYMYSVTPEFPLLALFYQVIPLEYWYMYMVVPIVAVYLLLVYAPQLLKKARKAN